MQSHNLPEHSSSTFRYCTNFAVTGMDLEGQSFVPALEGLGDSVLVVGDESTLRVHVHTDEPEDAVAIFRDVGEVSRLDVADMHEQVADRSARLGGDGARAEVQAACAVIAVASGDGMRRLYEDLGALVVDGGPTMNPSTYELLAGVHAAGGAEAIVLPNSSNVILAAERAAELSDLPARVVPTTAPQEGLAALLAFDPSKGSEHNAKAVANAAEGLVLGGVAPSARQDPQGRFADRRRPGLSRRRVGVVGRSRADAARDAGRGGRRRRAGHLPRGPRRPAGRRRGRARPARRGGAGAPGGWTARLVVAVLR